MVQPWFGWGLETYGNVFRIYNSQRAVEVHFGQPYYRAAHSDWLQLFAETGAVGTALIPLLLLGLLRGIRWRRAAAIRAICSPVVPSCCCMPGWNFLSPIRPCSSRFGAASALPSATQRSTPAARPNDLRSDMSLRAPISVLIPVKDEASNLAACLASVAFCDEIVVVDSDSTDGTRAIATQAGAGMVDFQWNGRFPKRKTGRWPTSRGNMSGSSSLTPTSVSHPALRRS